MDGNAKPGGLKAWLVLILLMAILAVSLLDRQIVVILAVDIQRDLGLSDSELGLIYGTVLGIFYALFSIPLGRLADGWVRTWQISIALVIWSLATGLSGLATGFVSLALARATVAAGEAGAGPASYSMLADLFSRSQRATAYAVYGAGTAIGVGVSTAFGGAVVDMWNARFPGGTGWFGLVGWQAALVAASLPGFLLAILILFVREPVRGLSDGIVQPGESQPFRRAGDELMALFPPLSFINLARMRASTQAWIANIGTLAAIVLGVLLLAKGAEMLTPPAMRAGSYTTHLIQWATVGLGIYATFSWIQAQKSQDYPAFQVMWTSPTFVAMLVIAVFNMTILYGLTAWGAPFAVQHFDASLSEVGVKLGGAIGIAGLSGMLFGGWLADFVRKRHPLGRIFVLLLSVVVPVPMAILAFTSETLDSFVSYHAMLSFALGSWLPCCTATLHDLVLPRMRGRAIALFYLGVTIFGMGTGPYIVGLMSDATGDLGGSVLKLYSLSAVVFVAVLVAMRTLRRDEASLIERARAAGEKI